jgi:hypothetical protein
MTYSGKVLWGIIILVLVIVGIIFLEKYNYLSSGLFGIQNTATAFNNLGVTRLTVKGESILDPSGNPIVLRGFNWGLWQYTDPQQDALQNVEEGANMVRIPLRWWGQYQTVTYEGKTFNIDSYDPTATSTGFINPLALSFLDQQIQAASSQHLWIDLFVGSDCGKGSAGISKSYCGTGDDGNQANLSNDPEMLLRFTAMWEFLANRYKNTPYIGMYEILSEPRFGCPGKSQICNPSETLAFYSSVISHVHAIDPRTPFLIGPSPTYNINDVSQVYIATTTPIIYTGDMLYSDVTKADESLPALLEQALAFRQTDLVPLFIQQVSAQSNTFSAIESAQTLLMTLNEDSIGWAWWTYRDDSGITAPYVFTKGQWNLNSSWLDVIESGLEGATGTALPPSGVPPIPPNGTPH